MRAVKGNKQYTINESQIKFYQEGGFDIYDDEGGLVSYGRDKKVSYEEYVAIKKELEELKQGETPKPTDTDVFELLTDYASEHGIDLGNTSSVSGAVKKIRGWKKENAQNSSPKAGG